MSLSPLTCLYYMKRSLPCVWGFTLPFSFCWPVVPGAYLVDGGRSQSSLHRFGQLVEGSIRSIWLSVVGTFRPTLLHWWDNPLLRHARRDNPLPWLISGRWFGVSMAALALLSVLSWVLNWRPLGALLIGMSLGVVLVATLAVPLLSADRVARQMHFAKHDPRRLTDLDPREVVWGLALVTLWRLRWLIIAGLAVTPALVIGLLRIDVASFAAWGDSVQALGTSTPASAVGWLLPDGHIPYFRLVMRALCAGLLPWVMLPLLASLGVTSALVLRDASLSPLVGLLSGVLLGGLFVSVWEGLARTPFLAGGLEIVRVILLVGLLVGIGAAAVWVNRWNGVLLVNARSESSGAILS